MPTAAEIAEQYGVKLGSELRSPEPAGSRWSKAKHQAFRRLGPTALCVVGTDTPLAVTVFDAYGDVRRRYGSNRGCWPLRLASTSSWADHLTKQYNRNPFLWTGVLLRVWCRHEADQARLATAVTGLLHRHAEDAGGHELIGGYVDVGPDLQLAMLEMEIHAQAERLGIAVMDDEGLSAALDRMLQQQLAKMGL